MTLGLRACFVMSLAFVGVDANGQVVAPPTVATVTVPLRGTCESEAGDDAITLPVETRQLSEIVGVTSCWDAKVDNDKLFFLNDLYSRWVVEELPLGQGPELVRDYRAEKSSPIVRFFVGKSRGAVMIAKIKMRDPDVEFTVPLITVDYDGRSGQGQAFVTAMTMSEMGLPDFRISPNSSVSIEASARVTSDVDVQAAGVVLAAVRDALSIAAPGGSLLTSINRDQVQRVSSAYDSAVSKLLSTTISESSSSGRLISEWFPGASIIVSVDVPSAIKTLRRAPARRLLFRISMACPRLSVFDPMTVCQTGKAENDARNMRLLINSPYYVAGTDRQRNRTGRPGMMSEQYRLAVQDIGERVHAHQVLSFRLGVGKTLRQYLTEQEWFISLSKKMVSPEPETKAVVDQAAFSEETKPNATLGQTAAADTPRGTKTMATSISAGAKKLSEANRAADEFCEAVVDKLFAAGLSRLDSQIGLWAIVTGVPDFVASRNYFRNGPGCRAHLPGQSWSYAESEAA